MLASFDGQPYDVTVDLDGPERDAAATPSRRPVALDAWAFLATGLPAVVGLAVLGIFPHWAGTLGESIAATLLIVALTATGLVLIREPQQFRSGVLMLVSAALVWVSWSYLGPGPFPYLATAFSWLWVIPMAWVILRYPGDRLGRLDRVVLVVAVVDLAVIPLLDASLGSPPLFGFASSTPWLGTEVAGAHAILRICQQLILAVLSVVSVVALVRKVRQSPVFERAVQAGVPIALGTAVATGGASAVAEALGAHGDLIDILDVIATAIFILVPIAFLWRVIRNRLVEVGRAQAIVVPDAGSHSTELIVSLLSPREMMVLELLAIGASNAAIQGRLRASAGSIERAIGNIYTKLGIPDESSVNRRVATVLHWQRSQK